MKVRAVNRSDLKKIANIHIQCFPNNFSTQLGMGLLEKFYFEYFSVNPELFLVGEEGDEIVGFCMGYYCETNTFMKSFFKHNIINILFKCTKFILTGNKLFYCKLRKKFKKSERFITINNSIDSIPLEKRGDLLSICVLEKCRGSGIAQMLIDAYEKQMLQSERDVCILTVDPDNIRAVRFYERNEYKIYKKAPTATTYVKHLM